MNISSDAYHNNWELIRRREKISDFSTFFLSNKRGSILIQAKIVEIEKIKLNVIPGTIFSVTRIFFLSLFEQENLVSNSLGEL